MANSATPSAKDRVPSIGSTTQTLPAVSRAGRPRSPPTARPSVGVVAAQLGMQEPVDREVGLGHDLARPFSQLSCGWRK